MPNNIKNIYQSRNFAQIEKVESQIHADFAPIVQNITTNPKSCWVVVQSENGVQSVLTWDMEGSYFYSYPLSITPAFNNQNNTDPNAKYIALVQFGMYSASTKCVFTHQYRIGLNTLVTGIAMASIVANTVGSFITSNYSYRVDQFAQRMNNYASGQGLPFNLYTPQDAEGALVAAIDFAMYPCTGRFTNVPAIVQAFNWDNVAWQFTIQALKQANYPGIEQDPSKINNNLIKCGSGTSFLPYYVQKPDIQVGYAVFLYDGKSVGVFGVGLQSIKNKDYTKGFTYAFKSTREQTLSGNVVDPLSLLNDPKTVFTKNAVSTVGGGVPISVGIDPNTEKLTNIIININKSDAQAKL